MPFSDYSHNSKFIAPFDSNCNIAIDLITSKYVHILALVKKNLGAWKYMDEIITI